MLWESLYKCSNTIQYEWELKTLHGCISKKVLITSIQIHASMCTSLYIRRWVHTRPVLIPRIADYWTSQYRLWSRSLRNVISQYVHFWNTDLLLQCKHMFRCAHLTQQKLLVGALSGCQMLQTKLSYLRFPSTYRNAYFFPSPPNYLHSFTRPSLPHPLVEFQVVNWLWYPLTCGLRGGVGVHMEQKSWSKFLPRPGFESRTRLAVQHPTARLIGWYILFNNNKSSCLIFTVSQIQYDYRYI